MMDEGTANRPYKADGSSVMPDAATKRRERQERRKEALDDALDHGLEETFPASDPVAVTQPPHSARDKRSS